MGRQQALAAEVIHDRKTSQPSAIAQTVTDEVHRPGKAPLNE